MTWCRPAARALVVSARAARAARRAARKGRQFMQLPDVLMAEVLALLSIAGGLVCSLRLPRLHVAERI